MFTMPHANAPLVAIVGCSAIKASKPAKARDFYRSPLFKASLAYAEVRTKNVVVASALHGAVKLDEVLEPYNFKLSSLGKTDRESWGLRVVNKVQPLYQPKPTDPPPVFLLLCGEAYADAILYGAHWRNLPRPETPLAKMKGVGNRIRWLNDERTRLEKLNNPWGLVELIAEQAKRCGVSMHTHINGGSCDVDGLPDYPHRCSADWLLWAHGEHDIPLLSRSNWRRCRLDLIQAKAIHTALLAIPDGAREQAELVLGRVL